MSGSTLVFLAAVIVLPARAEEGDPPEPSKIAADDPNAKAGRVEEFADRKAWKAPSAEEWTACAAEPRPEREGDALKIGTLKDKDGRAWKLAVSEWGALPQLCVAGQWLKLDEGLVRLALAEDLKDLVVVTGETYESGPGDPRHVWRVRQADMIYDEESAPTLSMVSWMSLGVAKAEGLGDVGLLTMDLDPGTGLDGDGVAMALVAANQEGFLEVASPFRDGKMRAAAAAWVNENLEVQGRTHVTIRPHKGQQVSQGEELDAVMLLHVKEGRTVTDLKERLE